MAGPLSIIGHMSRVERIILGSFLLLALLSGGVLLRAFYHENTVLIPTTGGTYIEGSVGELHPLNPWFTVTNDVNRDIVSLVFSGLLKYNPETKRIEDDLATLETSRDGTLYTVTLKDGLLWHDSTESQPHPVTADDALFTYQTIQNPQFGNELLRQNFRGVQIEKINDRMVRFRLDEPYTFFTSNLTIGLLPRRSFEGVPVPALSQAIDFGLNPIGAGPYRFKGIAQTDLSTEVTLERFVQRPIDPIYRLDLLVLRIFPDYPTLLSDIRSLDGVRLVPKNEQGQPIIPKRFRARSYNLPQYVALFLNLDRTFLQDQNLRLALQLGTNKQAIADAIHERTIVDTPLLEIDVADWRYHFDPEAAQGALFASNWHLPEKIRLQRLLEQAEANAVGPLDVDPVVLLDTGAVLALTGSLRGVPTPAKVNGLPIQTHPTASGAWIVGLPTKGTGAIHIGENLLRVTDDKGATIDSAYLWRSTKIDEYKKAEEEQRLVRLFVASREGEIAPDQRITVQDFFLEKGMLRRRLSSDPLSIRNNDNGELLSLVLLTSPSPPEYAEIGKLLIEQWRSLGVHLTLEIPETRQEFQERMLRRNYDVLLFGQSLLDNLDSHPYWHTSGVQRLTGRREDLRLDAYNLSQYSSFPSDTLLETVRRTNNEKERREALNQLREALKRDVPAIFLYSPLYAFAHKSDILGVELGALSLHSDRFLTLHRWYVKQERVFKPEKGWLSFLGWLPSLL